MENVTERIGDGIHSTPTYNEYGDYFFINGNNLVDGKIKIFNNTQKVTKEEALKQNANVLCDNSLLLSINGTIGNVAIYNNERIMLGKSACYINPSAKILRDFLFFYLQNSKIQKYFILELTGSTIKNLSLTSIKNTKLRLPSIQEQAKIAKLLRAIDERIATQNKIIEDLKKLKSAISEKLFKSAIGEIVTLREICDIIKGKQINGEYLKDSGKYYVMNGGTEPSGYYENYNVEANTISISEGGNSCGYVQFNSSPFWSGGHCYTIQNIKDVVDKGYLYHYLKSNEGSIMKLRIGSGLPNIQKKDLGDYKVQIITMDQQKSISACLSLLERKTEIEENLLFALQYEKQYLLRQMFI
ncbi:restriction endonuclease subunit S [Bacteroides timonensis]|uniref:restriction endonuclease subunit S n=1 Tax=Bacteroides timonensis TaxID=1470345 RepID=UPI0004AC6197|nr:restriction endonuclease subunit S [Bacteroides timonensis]